MAYDPNQTKHSNIKNWSNEDLLGWIKTINLSERWEGQMVAAIEESGCTGQEWCGFKSGQNVANELGIKQPMLSNRVFREFKKIRQAKNKLAQKTSADAEAFPLQIWGRSKYWKLNEYATPQTTVKYVKQLYRRSSASNCFCTFVFITDKGKVMLNEKTLGEYGIKDEKHLITVQYKAVGRGLKCVSYQNGKLQVVGRNCSFSISAFHVSCRSDKISGEGMMGIVLYLCDGKPLFYLNGMKCQSGYIMLVKANKVKNITTNQDTMHSKAFKHFTKMDLQNTNIVGGGFAIRAGMALFNSSTFNSATDRFHDGNREMNIFEEQCIRAAICNWKKGVQNTKVSDLYQGAICTDGHGFEV